MDGRARSAKAHGELYLQSLPAFKLQLDANRGALTKRLLEANQHEVGTARFELKLASSRYHHPLNAEHPHLTVLLYGFMKLDLGAGWAFRTHQNLRLRTGVDEVKISGGHLRRWRNVANPTPGWDSEGEFLPLQLVAKKKPRDPQKSGSGYEPSLCVPHLYASSLGRAGGCVSSPERMQEVQAQIRRLVPSIQARTRFKFGKTGREVTLCAWLTCRPRRVAFPHRSHCFGIVQNFLSCKKLLK
jgi:hypothetical protein